MAKKTDRRSNNNCFRFLIGGSASVREAMVIIGRNKRRLSRDKSKVALYWWDDRPRTRRIWRWRRGSVGGSGCAGHWDERWREENENMREREEVGWETGEKEDLEREGFGWGEREKKTREGGNFGSDRCGGKFCGKKLILILTLFCFVISLF